MPSKKPQIRVVLDEEIYQVLKGIAKKEERSMSNLAGKFIKQSIVNYEKNEKET